MEDQLQLEERGKVVAVVVVAVEVLVQAELLRLPPTPTATPPPLLSSAPTSPNLSKPAGGVGGNEARTPSRVKIALQAEVDAMKPVGDIEDIDVEVDGDAVAGRESIEGGGGEDVDMDLGDDQVCYFPQEFPRFCYSTRIFILSFESLRSSSHSPQTLIYVTFFFLVGQAAIPNPSFSSGSTTGIKTQSCFWLESRWKGR